MCTVGLKWEEEVGDKVDCEADKEEEKMDWGCAGGPVIEAMRSLAIMIRMRMMTLAMRKWIER